MTKRKFINPNSAVNQEKKRKLLEKFYHIFQDSVRTQDYTIVACPNCGSRLAKGGCFDVTAHVADIYDGFDGDEVHRVLIPPFCHRCGSHAPADHAHRIQNVPQEFRRGRCAEIEPTQLNESPNRVTMQNVPVHKVLVHFG